MSYNSIESSGCPLVFKTEDAALNLAPLPFTDRMARIRTMARPLEGMQKEALVQYGPTGSVWCIVCDEGPWLNGTDLAPFPLAYFTAGLAASFMSAFLEQAADRHIAVDSIRIELNNYFTMEGSALRGTMIAGTQPVQVTFSARGNATALDFEEIAKTAVQARCPAERLMDQVHASHFAVRTNNESLPWPGLPANSVGALADPAGLFKRVVPLSKEDTHIIRKSAGPSETGADAVGLKAEHKRIVHVRSNGTIREDGLKSIEVQCIQPAGSRFEFLSDDSRAEGGQERAPSGLVYLSAGVAFCFMTQIGRYAQITKQQLSRYRIIQDTGFRLARNGKPDASAVQTLVCLDTDEPQDKSIQLVQMAEQTCYIHAACRTPTETEVSFRPL